MSVPKLLSCPVCLRNVVIRANWVSFVTSIGARGQQLCSLWEQQYAAALEVVSPLDEWHIKSDTSGVLFDELMTECTRFLLFLLTCNTSFWLASSFAVRRLNKSLEIMVLLDYNSTTWIWLICVWRIELFYDLNWFSWHFICFPTFNQCRQIVLNKTNPLHKMNNSHKPKCSDFFRVVYHWYFSTMKFRIHFRCLG